MAGKFEVFTDINGDYRFRFKAANGEIIAASQAYSARNHAITGIESIKATAPPLPSSTSTTDM